MYCSCWLPVFETVSSLEKYSQQYCTPSRLQFFLQLINYSRENVWYRILTVSCVPGGMGKGGYGSDTTANFNFSLIWIQPACGIHVSIFKGVCLFPQLHWTRPVLELGLFTRNFTSYRDNVSATPHLFLVEDAGDLEEFIRGNLVQAGPGWQCLICGFCTKYKHRAWEHVEVIQLPCIFFQCSGSRIRCLFDPWIRDG